MATTRLRICGQRGDEIDLVLSDVIMPGMGGRELSRALATTRPTLPILFMSGYNDDGELAGAGGELGTGVLAKPFTSETLARQVREALDRREPMAPRSRGTDRVRRTLLTLTGTVCVRTLGSHISRGVHPWAQRAVAVHE